MSVVDSNLLLKLIAQISDPKEKAAVLAALSVKDKVAAIERFDMKKILFKEQHAACIDRSKKKVVVTSRRGGKSTMLAAKLLSTAMANPDSVSLYIGLTKIAARNVIWNMITKFIRDFQLPCRVNDHTLVVTFQNGARILIEGAKDMNTIERLRGMAPILVVIDEAQALPLGLGAYLVTEVIEPSMIDHGGETIIAGTPDPLCKSILYQAWKGQSPYKGYKQFHWNTTHNIKFPAFLSGETSPETYFQYILERTGYKEDDPGFIREYKGIFIEDKSGLVYGFDETRDLADFLPEGHDWKYVVSADLGFVDADAVLVLAFAYTHRCAYVVDCFSESKQDFTSMAQKIREFNELYNPVTTIVDPGGGGKKMVEELNDRYGIRSQAAEKYNPKAGGCMLVTEDFRAGRLKILNSPNNQLLISQLSNIVYLIKTDLQGNIKRVVPDGKQVVTADGVIGDDLADCLLYAQKYNRSYLAKENMDLTPHERMIQEVHDHKERVYNNDVRKAREEEARRNSPRPTWF